MDNSRTSVSSLLRTSAVSRSSWRSRVVSEGRLAAMKSASRTGSSMFKATVCRSSESCGDRATTSRKSSRAFRSRAESSVSRGPMRLVTDSTFARKNGLIDTTDVIRMRSRPSTKTTRLPLGILTVLWSLAIVPTRWRSTSVGSSTRGSSCATTAKRRSSPCKEFSKARELSRPTVNGRTPPGKRTVSRTGNTGSSGGTIIFSVFSAMLPPGDYIKSM